MSTPKVVLCTGSNQGLGYWVIQVAALRQPANTYILCSRNVDAGKEAIQKIRDAGVKSILDLIQLDVTNDDHIAAAVEHVQQKYGKLDGTSSEISINCPRLIGLQSS
jgi:NAD(P)-dependent dehydrogenase (short-subunit alcohol dehydrogenase family)